MEFEMQASSSDMAVQDNARWERNCRMAKEVATVIVAVAGMIGIAVEYANEKRKELCHFCTTSHPAHTSMQPSNDAFIFYHNIFCWV